MTRIFWVIQKYFGLIFAAASIGLFLVYKIPRLAFHFGDGNAYVYMAHAVLSGNLPYRDFFLADPPLLVLVLIPFKLVFGQHLILFQALPIILEVITAWLLYRILLLWHNPFACLAPLVYLFSFTVLAVSDFFTGIQLVVLLLILSLYLWEINKPIWSGVIAAAAVLTKLYALPVIGGWFLYQFLIKRYSSTLKALIGFAAVVIITIGPFAIIAPKQLWHYLIWHQLQRPPGLNKWEVFKFFILREWPMLLTAGAGALLSKKRYLLFPLMSVTLFFLIYQDLYYLYLQTLLPFIVLLTIEFFGWISKKSESGLVYGLIGIAFYTFFGLMSISLYHNDYALRGRFINAPEVAAAVRNLPQNLPLYGSHEVAPLVALLSEKPLFNNYIDTNTQAFASKAQNLQQTSKKAVEHGVYLIAKITDLPQYGIKDFGFEGYFDKSLFDKFCNRVLQFPSTSTEQDNVIAIYRCAIK